MYIHRCAYVYTYSEHFQITLGSLWGHFGVTLGTLWVSFWGHFEITLGSIWDHSGLILASFWPSGLPPRPKSGAPGLALRPPEWDRTRIPD